MLYDIYGIYKKKGTRDLYCCASVGIISNLKEIDVGRSPQASCIFFPFHPFFLPILYFFRLFRSFIYFRFFFVKTKLKTFHSNVKVIFNIQAKKNQKLAKNYVNSINFCFVLTFCNICKFVAFIL